MTKKLRVICFALVCVMMTLLVPRPVFAEAHPDALSAETVERVYEEVLTGEITNVEDVLAVAVAQYAEKNENAGIATCAEGDEPDDTPLQIVQQLEDTPDGCSQYAVTALLVLDEDNEPVTASGYIDMGTETITGNHGMNEYSIFATHTTYIGVSTLTGIPLRYRVSKAETVLVYGTAMTASQLVHEYEECMGSSELDIFSFSDTPIYNPSEGVTYTFTPFSSSNEGWYVAGTLGSYIQTSVKVFVGKQVFIIENPYSLF